MTQDEAKKVEEIYLKLIDSFENEPMHIAMTALSALVTTVAKMTIISNTKYLQDKYNEDVEEEIELENFITMMVNILRESYKKRYLGEKKILH